MEEEMNCEMCDYVDDQQDMLPVGDGQYLCASCTGYVEEILGISFSSNDFWAWWASQ